ncbi:MAG: hypothetical protein ACLRZ9_00500 [Eubacterium sp.]
MLNYYITEFGKWLDHTMPEFINEKYFLWLMGSIFLLGVVTKWIVMLNYGRLIRKAENMTNPKNATLRQIKMKFDSIKQVNGSVANPMLLVKRHLNRCKVGVFSLNRLNNVINWCTILIICISGLTGWELYRMKSDYMVIMAYIGTGCFFGFVLEMINRCIGVKDRQTELAYVIVDFLENNAMSREDRQQETLIDLMQEEEIQDTEQEMETTQKKLETMQEEQILNQVIGEFLQ